MEILKRRYARGDITREEYESIKRDLLSQARQARKWMSFSKRREIGQRRLRTYFVPVAQQGPAFDRRWEDPPVIRSIDR